MLIGLSGKIGSGKDTFCKIIQGTYPDYKFENKKFATKLKEIASIMTGYSIDIMHSHKGKNTYLDEWGMTIGEFQQKLGTEAMRNGVHQDAWILALFADYCKDGKTDNWIITDVRFPNEAYAILNREGMLIRLEGDPDNIRANSSRDMSHISETALDNFSLFTKTIINKSPIGNLITEARDLNL